LPPPQCAACWPSGPSIRLIGEQHGLIEDHHLVIGIAMTTFGQKTLAFLQRWKPTTRKAKVQELIDITRDVLIESKVMSALIVSLISNEIEKAKDKEGWIRNFSNEIHSSINIVSNPPPEIQTEIQNMSDRADEYITAAKSLSREK
jgi:hypothetical protein